jgi:hypothetical protein
VFFVFFVFRACAYERTALPHQYPHHTARARRCGVDMGMHLLGRQQRKPHTTQTAGMYVAPFARTKSPRGIYSDL